MANPRTRIILDDVLPTHSEIWELESSIEHETNHLEALSGPLTSCRGEEEPTGYRGGEEKHQSGQQQHPPPTGSGNLWTTLNARLANEVEYSASLDIHSANGEVPLQIDPRLKMNIDYQCFRRIIIRDKVYVILEEDTVTFLTEAAKNDNVHPMTVLFRVDTDIAMPEVIRQVNIKLRLMRNRITAHGQTFIMSGAAEIDQTLPVNIPIKEVLSAASDVRLIVCWFVTVPIRGNRIKFRIAIRASELPDVKSPPDYSINIECEETISFDEFKLIYFALAWYYNAQLESQTVGKPTPQSEPPAVPILVPVYRVFAVHRKHCDSIRNRLSDFQYDSLLAMKHVPLGPQLHQLSNWLTETVLLPTISHPPPGDGN